MILMGSKEDTLETTAFRPAVGEEFQVADGYHDDEIFRVREYRPLTAAPELIQEMFRLDTLPTEAVECVKLERHDQEWIGTARHTFPVDIMVPVGTTKTAFTARFGGTKQRAPRATGDRCGRSYQHIDGDDAAALDAWLQDMAQPEGSEERIAAETGHATCPDCGRDLKVQAIKSGGVVRSRIYPQHNKP